MWFTVQVEFSREILRLMVREGYKDVGQLHGGIATYGKDPEVQGELWDGKMYTLTSVSQSMSTMLTQPSGKTGLRNAK